MTRPVRQMLVGLALMVATAAHAQQPASAAPQEPLHSLTLRQAVTQALEHNPNRVRAMHEVTAAGYDKAAAEWGRWPTLSVDAGAGQATRGLVPTTTLRLEQPLWAGGRIEGQIEAAKALVAAAQSGEGEARRRVAEETAAAYVGWVRAAERVEIARVGAQALDRLLNYVKRREQEGLNAPSDVSFAGARHANALATLEQARGELDQARALLEALMVARIEESRDRAAGSPVSVPVVPERPLPDVEADYVAQSQLVSQRRAEVESARAQAQVRRGQIFPTVALRLEHLYYQDSAPFGTHNDSRALLVLQYQPGAGLGALSAYQAGASRIDSAQAQLASDENDARLRARANMADLRTSTRQIAELEPQVQALDAATDSFLRQFEAGRKSWLEVLNTQREVLDAKLALARARMTRDQAALRLMVNTGTFWSWLETQPSQ